MKKIAVIFINNGIGYLTEGEVDEHMYETSSPDTPNYFSKIYKNNIDIGEISDRSIMEWHKQKELEGFDNSFAFEI